MKIKVPYRCLLMAAGCSLAAALAQDSTPKPAVVSAEPTAFREVTAKLDPGGNLYAYLSTDQFLGSLSAKVRELRQFVLGLPDMGSEDRSQVEHVFGVIQSLVQHSGIENLSGVGFSGIAVEKGLYRTRFVMQRNGADEGYLWRFFGMKPHPLSGLDLLPADTAWAFFADVDLKGIWDALAKEAGDAKLTPLIEGMRELSSNIQMATGRTLEEQLASFGGELGVALTLDPKRSFNLPIEQLELKDLPEPGLFIALKVKDDALFEWIDAAVSQNPQSSSGKTDTARWRSLNVPAPVPFPVRPTVARLGDYLIVASNDGIIERLDRVRGGKEPNVKSTPEWQRLAKGLPTDGNSLSYVSPRFGETISKLQQAMMEQAAAQSGGQMPDLSAIQKLLGLSGAPSSYAVGWSDASGSQAVSQGTQEPTSVLVASAVVAPAAIVAGMTLPALAKAKGKAQEVTCMNNLKQIALGMIMYANDHDDALPADFKSIKEYLGGSQRVFVCPADTIQASAETGPTWEEISEGKTSYNFVAPGIKVDGGNPMTTVIARCRIHGTAAYLDGHVARPTP